MQTCRCCGHVSQAFKAGTPANCPFRGVLTASGADKSSGCLNRNASLTTICSHWTLDVVLLLSFHKALREKCVFFDCWRLWKAHLSYCRLQSGSCAPFKFQSKPW